MRIADSPVADVRGPLTAQRQRLLDLLAGFRDAQWAAPTVAPQWSVKNIALHLIDVDLSWVALSADGVRTFMWRFPHHYRAPAPVGTAVALEISGVGVWTLIRPASGWTLLQGQPADPAASLRTTGDAAWRPFTGVPYDVRQVQISGQPALAQPLLRVRGIIV